MGNKCAKKMADGGVIEKIGDRVRAATRGIADFMNIGKPTTTKVLSGGRTQMTDDKPIVPAETIQDMPEERNPRRFAEEVDQRKKARSGEYARGGVLPYNDSAERINQPVQAAYPGGIAAFVSGVQDAAMPQTSAIGPDLAQAAAPVGMSPQSQGLLTGIKDYSTTPAQLANMGKSAFVNSDGSSRDMGQPAAPAVQAPPVMNMKERDIANGFDPNRAYRPGSIEDPYASSNVGQTGVAPSQPEDMSRNPLSPIPSMRRRKQTGFSSGGIVQFAGAGGPREDKIPVRVAGHNIKVSDGEAAVILPAKTAANHAAVQGIKNIIQQSNDGIPPNGGIQDGGHYMRGGIGDGLPVRYVPDEIDLARGQLETARAQAADRASRSAYQAELATRDVMASRAAEQANMRAAIDAANSQPAIKPKAVPAQPISSPNWAAGNNAPVLEGVVETSEELRAKAAPQTPLALGAPQPGTAVAQRSINWIPGGNPPPGGPMTARTIDWTYGNGGGPYGNVGGPRAGAFQGTAPALPAPAPELMKASADARTAAGAKAAGKASKEATAYANRPAFETSPFANVRPNAALAGKVVNRIIPVVGGAISTGNIADVATDPNKTGADVATQVAREAGGIGSAAAGGALGAKAGAALGSLGGPIAPITIPAGALIGGIGGALAANYGANALMDIGGDAPVNTSKGVVTRFFGGNEQNPVADPVRAKHNAILNSGSAAGTIKLPITQAAKQDAFVNTDAARRAAANEDSGATMRHGIVSADMGRGFDPTKLQMAPGYGMASNAAGKTLSIGPSQYVAADGSPTSRWEDTQSYQDAIARNERNKMRLAEMQSLRLGADPMAIQAASQGIASSLLANKQTQAQIARDAELQGIIRRAAAESDAGKREQLIEAYLAARGKDKKQEKDWVMSDGGQDAVDNGMGGKITVNRPPIAFNTKTREVIRLDGSSAGNTATGSAPYSDGTRLHGKDGKMYVVRNGVPVLEGK